MKIGDKPATADIKNLNNALLMDLTDRQIEAVREIMSVIEVERGEMIIREGDLSDEGRDITPSVF
jgi:CRP-like cAMP-binding protein